jgi:hypothetical protein
LAAEGHRRGGCSRGVARWRTYLDISAKGPGAAYQLPQGLLNPDGILGVVPGSWPLQIIYEQKILNGDQTGGTALPANQQCNTFWAGYYANNPFGIAVNDDITYLRLAETTDGINFTDKGILQGLNDPTDVRAGGTMGFFAGRVYAPSAVRSGFDEATVIFAGYHTPKPKNGLGDYRTIGRVSLRASQPLLVVGAPGADSDDQDTRQFGDH